MTSLNWETVNLVANNQMSKESGAAISGERQVKAAILEEEPRGGGGGTAHGGWGRGGGVEWARGEEQRKAKGGTRKGRKYIPCALSRDPYGTV